MALQLGALRDALIAAGASDEKANRAAEEAAGYENRLARPEADVSVIKADLAEIKAALKGFEARIDASLKSMDSRIDNRFAQLELANARVRGERVLMRWMVGTVIAFQIALFLKMFAH